MTVGKPIVRKLGAGPVQVSLKGYRAEPMQQGEGGEWLFDIQVVAEQLDKKHARRAEVGANIDGYSTFEIESDEGTALGGEDAAPSPLEYLSVGVAFCLLSHVKVYAQANRLNIESARIDQIVRFSSTATPANYRAGNAHGACLGLDVELQLGTDEDESRIAELEDAVKQSCMALQAMVTPVDARVKVSREQLD